MADTTKWTCRVDPASKAATLTVSRSDLEGGSSYFAGFTLAALRCGPIIERVGHIRAYAAFAGMVVAATAAMPLLLGPLSWLVLRAVVGFGCAGLFITTESWLNAKAQPAERGRIFSIYMVGTFLALALGQLLIGPAKIETTGPFNAIVALFAVALVMVSTTRAEPPRLTAAATLPYSELARSTRRGRRRRVEWAHQQLILRACSGLDAGRRHRARDDRNVHAGGGARWARVPGSDRPALRPLRPAYRAGRARPWLRGRRHRSGPSAALPAGPCRWSCRPQRCSAALCLRFTRSASPTHTTACRPTGSWR